MAEEIEAKILDIDIPALEAKLASIGAIKVQDYFFQIKNWDFPGFPLRAKHSWVRLRTDGTHTTLAYKERRDTSTDPLIDSGMDEYEVTVSSFAETETILRKLGMIEKHLQEKKRTSWRKGEVVYDIDTWPLIPSFLEIEGPSWDLVDAAVVELGFDLAQKKVCSADDVSRHYGVNWNEYSHIGFDLVIKRENL